MLNWKDIVYQMFIDNSQCWNGYRKKKVFIPCLKYKLVQNLRVKSDKMYSNLYKSFISFETALSLLEIYPNKYSPMCAHLHIKDILNPYWILKKWVIQKSNNWLLIIAGDSVAIKICFWNIYYENIKVHRKKYFKLLEKCLSSHKNVYF